MTENEDGNTHLFTVTPSAPAAQQVVQYAYSPNPRDASAPVTLGTGLTVLKTPFTLDDIRWATSDNGALYVINNGGTVPGGSAIYKLTGPFRKNTVLASNDGVGDQVVTVNLATGTLTPFVRHLMQTTGLVYLDPSGTQTELALNGRGRNKPANRDLHVPP